MNRPHGPRRGNHRHLASLPAWGLYDRHRGLLATVRGETAYSPDFPGTPS